MRTELGVRLIDASSKITFSCECTMTIQNCVQINVDVLVNNLKSTADI